MAEVKTDDQAVRAPWAWGLFELFIGGSFLLMFFVESKSGHWTAVIFGPLALASFYSAWQFHTGRRKPVGNLGKSIVWGIAFAGILIVPLVLWLVSTSVLDCLP